MSCISGEVCGHTHGLFVHGLHLSSGASPLLGCSAPPPTFVHFHDFIQHFGYVPD